MEDNGINSIIFCFYLFGIGITNRTISKLYTSYVSNSSHIMYHEFVLVLCTNANYKLC